MYSSVLPSYNTKKDGKGNNNVINADDPRNKDKVHSILYE